MLQSGEIPVPTFALGSFTRVTLPVSSFIPWPGFSFSDQHYKIRLQLNVLLKKKKNSDFFFVLYCQNVFLTTSNTTFLVQGFIYNFSRFQLLPSLPHPSVDCI